MNSVAASQAVDYGALTFGIGTEANNIPASTVQVFPGNINNGDVILTKYGVFAIEGYIDSGTNEIAFNDSTIPQCAVNNPPNGPWYCPSSPKNANAVNEGESGTPTNSVNFTVGNASSLIQNGVYALPELAGPFGTPGGFAGGLFDWGLPFFYGRTVYVGFELESALINSKNTSGPFFAY
jgi:hypothetical protein